MEARFLACGRSLGVPMKHKRKEDLPKVPPRRKRPKDLVARHFAELAVWVAERERSDAPPPHTHSTLPRDPRTPLLGLGFGPTAPPPWSFPRGP